jgi:DUF971 family protein
MTDSQSQSTQNTTPKVSGPAIRVKAIRQVDDRNFSIQWTDGSASQFDVVDLRRKCPCATCIDEWTHETILRPEQVSESVRPLKIESVGQYALTVHFSDGHKTGIYPFTLLRKFAALVH